MANEYSGGNFPQVLFAEGGYGGVGSARDEGVDGIEVVVEYFYKRKFIALLCGVLDCFVVEDWSVVAVGVGFSCEAGQIVGPHEITTEKDGWLVEIMLHTAPVAVLEIGVDLFVGK